MLENICSLPLSSDVFALAVHPSLPLFTVGQTSGHVSTHRLPSSGAGPSDTSSLHSVNTSTSEDGRGVVETAWKTKRHEEACRSVCYTWDGERVISAGAEGIVKIADTESGKVQWKIRMPLLETKLGRQTQSTQEPCIVHNLNPQSLLVGTDQGKLLVYDTRVATSSSGSAFVSSERPSSSLSPHDGEYISSLLPLPPTAASTSGFSKQWLTTGGDTLCHSDIRKGIIKQSESQETELLSSVFVGGLSKRGTNVGEKIVTGTSDGILTLWERGVYDDQDERILVHKGLKMSKLDSSSSMRKRAAEMTGLPKSLTTPDSTAEPLDVLCNVPDDVVVSARANDPRSWVAARHSVVGKMIAVGMGDGRIRFVRIGPNKVVEEIRHDEMEGVVGLAWDKSGGVDGRGRMISAGGGIVKIWEEIEEEEDEQDGSDDDDEDDEEDDDDDESEDESEEEKPARKRRRGGKGDAGGVNGSSHTNGVSFADID